MTLRIAVRRTYAALLGGCVLLLCLMVSPGAPAHAHDQVIDQTPKAGEHFGAPPEEVVLTFNAEPLTVGATIMVVDAEGKAWESGEPNISGPTATQKFKQPLPEGNYQVRWRIVSSDGHPISESFLFSVGDVADAAPVPTPESGGEPISDSGNEDQTESVLDAGAEEADSGSSSGLRTVLLAGAGAIIALALFVAWRFTFSRSSRPRKGTRS